MKVITLYRYTREDGGVTTTPIKPDCEYTTKYRIVADEGKCVTLDGVAMYQCIDTDIKDGWYEVDEVVE